jgi:hypothetical protein
MEKASKMDEYFRLQRSEASVGKVYLSCNIERGFSPGEAPVMKDREIHEEQQHEDGLMAKRVRALDESLGHLISN